jgi:hypothetical protein
MLGYVVPLKSELKLREFEVYSSYYCGICHSIRDRYGQLPRLLLSYDSVFLAMLIDSMDPSPETIGPFRCMTHPGRKRNIAAETEGVAYAADMMLLLGYFNLKDDKEDENSLLGNVGELYLRRAYKKIQRKMPEKCEAIAGQSAELSRLERSGEIGIDVISEPFARLMETVMDRPNLKAFVPEPTSGLTKERYADDISAALRKIGYFLGKWIYLIDAISDLRKDIKSGSFNPLKQESLTVEEIIDANKARLELLLQLYLANIAEVADLLPIRKNKVILENVIYLGLNRVTIETLCEPERKRRFYAKSI